MSDQRIEIRHYLFQPLNSKAVWKIMMLGSTYYEKRDWDVDMDIYIMYIESSEDYSNTNDLKQSLYSILMHFIKSWNAQRWTIVVQ